MVKRFALALLVVSCVQVVRADSFAPCSTTPVAITSIENTICAIGDKDFSFGTANIPSNSNSLGLTLGDIQFQADTTDTGFQLLVNTGPASTSKFAEFFLPVTVTAAAATITGMTTTNNLGLSVFELCTSGNALCKTANFIPSSLNTPGAFSPPIQNATGNLGSADFLDSFGGNASASYVVTQTSSVPEPTSLLLMGTGLAAASRSLVRKRKR